MKLELEQYRTALIKSCLAVQIGHGKMTLARLTCVRNYNLLLVIQKYSLHLLFKDPLKNFVETHNKSRLDQLEGDIYEFKAVDTAAEKNKLYMESLANSCPAPYLLQLKKGAQVCILLIKKREFPKPDFYAQVILLKNIDVEHELFNGARGKVIDFERDHQTKQIYPVIEFESGRIRMIRPEKWSLVIGSEEVASREQLPLNLAWALSIHKVCKCLWQ